MAWELSHANDPLKILMNQKKGRTVELTTYGFIGIVVVLYLIAFIKGLEDKNVNNVNRIFITVAYFVVMLVTIISSVVFLCVLSRRYGRQFMRQTKKQMWYILIVFAIAYIYRISFNIWYLSKNSLCNFS